MNFKLFYESITPIEKDDLKETLGKIPKEHRNIIKGYSFFCKSGNTLKDGEHVGYNDLMNKRIVIATPWNYSREFTLLHEIAHLVWDRFVKPNDKKVKKWNKLVSSTKDKVKQNNEELFCHTYANYYVKNKVNNHHHEAWYDFIKNEI